MGLVSIIQTVKQYGKLDELKLQKRVYQDIDSMIIHIINEKNRKDHCWKIIELEVKNGEITLVLCKQTSDEINWMRKLTKVLANVDITNYKVASDVGVEGFVSVPISHENVIVISHLRDNFDVAIQRADDLSIKPQHTNDLMFVRIPTLSTSDDFDIMNKVLKAIKPFMKNKQNSTADGATSKHLLYDCDLPDDDND